MRSCAARRRAGLAHASCHELRHTCLTRLREAGMALEAVQAQAGHASIESTRIYLHLADDWLAAQYRKAAEVIDAQVFAASPPDRAPSPGATGEPAAAAGRQRNGPRCPPGPTSSPPLPQIAATMRRYLTQMSCVLRPGSVAALDLALRCFAAFLAQTAPEVTSTAQVTRRHIEDYKPWLAARPGQNKSRLTTATTAHRLGTLRMFFVRPTNGPGTKRLPGAPMFPGDLPRQDHPLPKALDDAGRRETAARRLQNDKRLLVRVTAEMLLRTGLRVSEYTSLRADAVVHIGAGPWLHVPVGKSAKTATCRCTRTWSPSSTTTAPVTSPQPLIPCCCPARTAAPSRPPRRHPLHQQGLAPPPGCPISTRTGSGTPSPPRRSTGA